MEARIQEALEYLSSNPTAKVATVAKEFGVLRFRLRNRINGIGPRKGRQALYKKLSDLEETALCRYIDRLDRANLAVRVAYVTDVANYILASRASRVEQPNPPVVGPNWASRFLKRYGYFKRLQRKLYTDR